MTKSLIAASLAALTTLVAFAATASAYRTCPPGYTPGWFQGKPACVPLWGWDERYRKTRPR